MKVLLFGKNGQLGWELNRSLQSLGEVVSITRDEIDYTDLNSLRKYLYDTRPDIVINAVAFTDVGKAESERDAAFIINAEAPKVLAQLAINLDYLLVHYSTDYVFDGVKSEPYLEDDRPGPLNVYGESKLEGEKAIQSSGCRYLIFRTSWVYSLRGNNFLLTMRRLMMEREEIDVVVDQIGAPTPAELIADVSTLFVRRIIDGVLDSNEIFGLYHLTTSGSGSWYEFSKEILRLYKSDERVTLRNLKPVLAVDFPSVVGRPKNSRLNCEKIKNVLKIELPDWKDALSMTIGGK